ncbi:glycine reductase, partial [Clostridioides difficile]|nr:glycine reductase [Clostridioides difficile]
VSRASGSPVVANALKYAYDVVKGDISNVARNEFATVKKAKFADIISSLTKKEAKAEKVEVKMPDKEIVTRQIAGVDIMDLEDAVSELWKNGIYAESGMG